MTARDDILRSVRRALAGVDKSPISVSRPFRDRAGAAELVDMFVDRVIDYGAMVERCADEEVAVRVLRATCDSRVVVPDGLPWLIAGASRDSQLSAAELDQFNVVVTGATLGIAATGTIVLTHGRGQGRRALTLVPDRHICVVRAADIVPDVPAAVALLDPELPQTWISGPSATSDIELIRVEGVHGPRNLHVLLVVR